MQMQERENREIDLLELFWKILFSWRQVICFGVIFAILFGGMKYVKDIRAYQVIQNDDVEESELSEDEMLQVSEAINLKRRMHEYENYLESSALMNTNLYEKPVVELQYYIDSDYTFNYTKESKIDYTSDLTTMYSNYITSGEMGMKIMEKVKSSVNLADISEFWSVNRDGNSIFISFTCPDENKMDDIAESIKEQLRSKEKEFQEVGIHELKLLSESENLVVDNALIDRKNAISNSIAALNTQFNNLMSVLTDEQIDLVEKEQGGEEEVDELKISKPKLNLKYTILGAAIGIFLVCIYIVYSMLFSADLQNSEEIRLIHNIRLLGEVEIQPKKKRLLSGIDDLLVSLKYPRKKKLTLAQQIKMIASKVSLYCKQYGTDCIYITGSDYGNVDNKFLVMLKEEMISQNIQIKEGENIFYNAESLKQGTEIGTMLFVEQVGHSIFKEITNELHLAEDQNNNILGVIVLV